MELTYPQKEVGDLLDYDSCPFCHANWETDETCDSRSCVGQAMDEIIDSFPKN